MKRIFFCVVAVVFGATGSAFGENGEDPLLDVGYSSSLFFNVDERDALASTTAWLKQIVETYGSEDLVGSKAYILHDLGEAAEAVRNETVDLLILTPLEFVRLRNHVPLLPIYTSSVLGSQTVHYRVLVRRDSEIRALSDLVDRRLLIDTATRGALAKMWLETELLNLGHGPMDSFLGSVVESQKLAQTVLPVFFGKADACVVPAESFETMVALNPQLGRDLVAVATSERFFTGIVCARRKFYQTYGVFLDEVIPSLHELPRGQQMLSMFHIEKLIPYSTEHIEEVVRLLDRYTRLTQSYAQKR